MYNTNFMLKSSYTAQDGFGNIQSGTTTQAHGGILIYNFLYLHMGLTSPHFLHIHTYTN